MKQKPCNWKNVANWIGTGVLATHQLTPMVNNLVYFVVLLRHKYIVFQKITLILKDIYCT